MIIVNFPSSFFNDTKYINKKEIEMIEVKNIKEAIKYYKKNKYILLEEYKAIPSLMKKFSEGNAKIIINLKKIIKNKGFKRAKEIALIKNFLKICVKFGINFIFATFEENKENARTWREIIHIGFLIGLNAGQTKLALKQF